MKTNVKEIFQYVLGALVVLCFFAVIVLLIIIGVPSDNKEALLLILGALIGAFSSVMGYFYGSSIGSAKKTDLMNKQNE